MSENDVVCEDVQTLSVSSVEDSEEWKEVSGGPGEQLEDEDVQCHDGDLDYVEEKKEEVEEIEPEAMVEEKEVEAEELEVEDNPNRGKSSKVSYLDSNLDEINQYCSTQDSFSESDVHKERVPKVRHKRVRQSG